MIKKMDDNFSMHTWNEDDDDFYQQLEEWFLGKVFSDQPEPVTRELRAYIEYWGDPL